MIVDIRCRGLSPLLQNRMTENQLEALRTKAKKAKAADIGTTRTPREEADHKVYRTQDGRPYIPGENLMACLIGAGTFVRLDQKRQISTAKTTLLPGLMALLTPIVHLVHPDTGKPAAWEPDVRKGTNPHGAIAVAICRPRFDAWAIEFAIDIDTEEIGENAIRELVDKAGRRIGLGDFRPQRKGIFGQFCVESWVRKEERAAAE